MPSWPVSPRLRRRFTANQLVLLAPIGAQALGLSEGWQQLLQAIQSG